MRLIAALLLAFLAACVAAPLAPSATPTANALPATATATPRPTLAPTPAPTLTSYDGFLPRPSPTSLRVLSYNVNWDSIFPDDDPQNHELRTFNRVEAFGRILAAIQPDVICLQELNYLRSSAQIAALIAEAAGDSSAWFVAKERDTFIVSRYPLVQDGYALTISGVVNAHQKSAALG